MRGGARASSTRTWRGWRAAARGSASRSTAWRCAARRNRRASRTARRHSPSSRSSSRAAARRGAATRRADEIDAAAHASRCSRHRGNARRCARWRAAAASRTCGSRRESRARGHQTSQPAGERAGRAASRGHAELSNRCCSTLAGRSICGTMSNVFVVRDGRLLTPRVDRCGVAGVHARDRAARSAGARAFRREERRPRRSTSCLPRTRCSSPMRASGLCRCARVGEHRFPHDETSCRRLRRSHRGARCVSCCSLLGLLLVLAGAAPRLSTGSASTHADAAPRAARASPSRWRSSRALRCARCSPSSTRAARWPTGAPSSSSARARLAADQERHATRFRRSASPAEILRQLDEGRVVLEALTVVEGWTFARHAPRASKRIRRSR